MQFIKPEQLHELIKRNGYKVCIVYDQALHKLRPDLPNFDRFENEDPEGLAQSVADFCSVYTGIYSFVLRKTSGGSAGGTTLAKVQLGGSTAVQNNQQQPGTTIAETPQQMEIRILTKMRGEMLMQQMQSTNKSLQAKLDGLETSGGKLSFMIENFIMAKLGKKIPEFQNTAMQGTEGKEKDIDAKELEAAYMKLSTVIGPAVLIKLASKLKKGDPVLEMVKNYANT